MKSTSNITIFLCGDVMTGRGIDQILSDRVNPRLHEPYMTDARGYVELAVRKNGPFDIPVTYDYIWGDALREFEIIIPDLRIINLETSITTSDDYMEYKHIHYRMHPRNVRAITAAGIDVCVLANNHVLDFGRTGLEETIKTLREADIAVSGAGLILEEAEDIYVRNFGERGRVLVYSVGHNSSGIPPGWAAVHGGAGINYIENLSRSTVRQIKNKIGRIKKPGDIAVLSIHWGGNWGYTIDREFRNFAHALIDEAGIDIIHGHSSHHVMGIELYRGKPVLYGCGDFINDYEGISGYEEYRSDLALMYFLEMDPATSMLVSLRMTPLKMKNFRLQRATAEESGFLLNLLNREGRVLNTSFYIDRDRGIRLK